MAASQGNPRIPYFDYYIHTFKLFFERLFGLGDVAWIPLNQIGGMMF
jgi:hypothetical protein